LTLKVKRELEMALGKEKNLVVDSFKALALEGIRKGGD
jgi:hypothetical protein